MANEDDDLLTDSTQLMTAADPSTQYVGVSEVQLQRAKQLALRWEARYQEAAIYLQEGFENDSFASHPKDSASMQAYRFVHSPAFHILDVCAALLLMALALVEAPAVDKLQMPTQGHALVELLLLLVLAMDLLMRMRWLKWTRIHKHKRIILKSIFLVIMLAEAISVAVREKSHFRITRCLRPLFLLDSYYCMGARRVARQIVQSLPPILDMMFLLLFVMVIFSVFGYFLFKPDDPLIDPNFSTFKNSFVSLFVLVTTANYPDVMMPAYNRYPWAPAFFIIYLCITLYILLNLLTAVVYSTFQEFEKQKFRKLILHQREAVQKMFKLLCGKRQSSLPFIHFRGVMRYYSSSTDDVACRCVFKVLNASRSGRLSLDECQHVYDAVLLKWGRVNNDMRLESWYAQLPRPLLAVADTIHRIIEHKIFHYFIILTLVANCVFMLQDAATGQVTETADNRIASVVFTSVYTIEAMMKNIGLGPRQYFAHSWNVFDFGIVIASLIGLLAQMSHLRFFVVLRPLRLLRLLELKKRYQDVLATLFVLLPRMANVGLLLVVFFYFFAIIGMEFFATAVSPGCCVNSPVSAYYAAGNETVYYYLNSFDNVLRSYVTLFELMVVNNWFVIMDGFVAETSEWARIYFMLFYLMSLMVVNIVVAFILDAFLFRIASQRETIEEKRGLEGDLSMVEVTLSPQEMNFKPESQNMLTPMYGGGGNVRFKGRRRRTKADLSIMMYQDEVKEWCREADATMKHFDATFYPRGSTSTELQPTSGSLMADRSATSESSLASDVAGSNAVLADVTSTAVMGSNDTILVHRSAHGHASPIHLSHSSLHYDPSPIDELTDHFVCATSAPNTNGGAASTQRMKTLRSVPQMPSHTRSFDSGCAGDAPGNAATGSLVAHDPLSASGTSARLKGRQTSMPSLHQHQHQHQQLAMPMQLGSSVSASQTPYRFDSGTATPSLHHSASASNITSPPPVDPGTLSANISRMSAGRHASARRDDRRHLDQQPVRSATGSQNGDPLAHRSTAGTDATLPRSDSDDELLS